MDARSAQHLGELTGSWGLGVVVANVVLEQLGLPIPAVPLLLVAGALAAEHREWATEVFLLATIACVVTDIGWYLAGALYGNRIMRFLCRISLTPDSCVSDTQRRFERWGGKVLVFGKFVPGLTLVAMPLAGAQRMPWLRFLSLSGLGSALWIAAPLALGMLAARQIDAVLVELSDLGGKVLVLLALALTAYLSLKWQQRRRFYKELRMARIEPQELQALLQAPSPALVLDVRTQTARALDPRAIPNALYVSPEEVPGRLAELAGRSEVVVYCTCPNEASAAQVAKLLMQRGVARVRPLRGGLDAWAAAGYAVDPIAPVAVNSTVASIVSSERATTS